MALRGPGAPRGCCSAAGCSAGRGGSPVGAPSRGSSSYADHPALQTNTAAPSAPRGGLCAGALLPHHPGGGSHVRPEGKAGGQASPSLAPHVQPRPAEVLQEAEPELLSDVGHPKVGQGWQGATDPLALILRTMGSWSVPAGSPPACSARPAPPAGH